MKTINLKNKHLATFSKLLNYPMNFVQGRLRNRFLSLINPKVSEMEENRIELCKKLCLKDKDGKEIIKDGSFQFPENSEFPQELAVLYGEDCIIDVPSALRSDIGGVKRMIELSTVVLKTDEQDIAEEIVDILSTSPKEEPEEVESKA